METDKSAPGSAGLASGRLTVKSVKTIQRSGAPAAPSTGCGCGKQNAEISEAYVTGQANTQGGAISRVSTTLSFADHFGSFRARMGIGRMDYKVAPGLYCVGEVDENAPVLVTANYKLTFDALRKELGGLSAYILVLDTKGINVWCAAGKGTFGTAELVRRVKAAQLDKVVAHRTLVLPQLGAVGVAAHEVARRTGFRVVYGPVRASDLSAFLAAGMSATREMRTVKFTARDRLVLTPIELFQSFPYIAYAFCAMFILNALGIGNYGLIDFAALLGALVAGTVLTPFLLPVLPFRAFSAKGALLGLLWAVGLSALYGFPAPSFGLLKAIAYLLLIPALSAFGAMNFTGCSTFTSLSGVNKEMKIALPLIIPAAFIGAVLLIVGGILSPLA